MTADLRRLGVRGTVMVHTRMSALGWVVGGSEMVVRSLLEALGPEGTLMAYASWADHVYTLEDRPQEHRAAYLAEPPRFDPATGEVDPDYGRIPERLRTWPGTLRSTHPEASVVAIGPRADRLTAVHEDGYGAGSPFARLVEAGGHPPVPRTRADEIRRGVDRGALRLEMLDATAGGSFDRAAPAASQSR